MVQGRGESPFRMRAKLNCARSSAAVLFMASEALAYNCPQSPSPAQTDTYQGFLGRVQRVGDQELPYRLFVPGDYNPATAYPLVLYLHHAGLAGDDQNNDSGWDNCVQLTSEIGSGDDYGGVFTHRAVDANGTRFDTQAKYPHFVLAPHAKSPAYGFGGGVEGSATRAEHATRPVLWAILEAVRGEFNIDARRLYITGISMGCYGTWDIIMRNPGVFAAASPQSCRGDPNTTLLARLKDMPIWSMCGTNDSYFAGAQAMANGMTQIGETAFTFTAMEGVGHSINDRGYDYPGFIDWMFAQRLPGGSGGAGGGGGGGASGMAGIGGIAGSVAQGGAGAAAMGGSGEMGGASAQSGAGAFATGGGGASGLGGNAGGGGAGGQGAPPAGGAGAQGVGGAGGEGAGTPVPRMPANDATESGCSVAVAPSKSKLLAGLLTLILGAAALRRRQRCGQLRTGPPPPSSR
jgi:MYXO-CTERM domain-containing protein